MFILILFAFFSGIFILSFFNGNSANTAEPAVQTALQRLSGSMSGVYLSFLYPIIMIGIGADLFSSELSSGTIKTMLLRPVGRLTILHAKLALLFSSSLLLLFFSYLLIYLFNLQHGTGDWGAAISIWAGKEYTVPMWFCILFALLLNALTLAAVSSIIICISYFIRNAGLAVTLTMLAIVLPKLWLAPLQGNLPVSRYYFSQHLDLVSILTGNSPIDTTLRMSAVVLSVSGCLAYLLVAWRIKREDLPC